MHKQITITRRLRKSLVVALTAILAMLAFASLADAYIRIPPRHVATLPKEKRPPLHRGRHSAPRHAAVRAADTYATQWSAPADCLAGRIQSRPPRFATSLSGGTETLYWSSDLWKYTATGWQAWDTSKPWLHAVVNANGIMPVNGSNWYNPSGWPQTFFPYDNLAPAWYAVKEFYKFQNGTVRTQWSYFNMYDTSQIYCHT